VDFAQWIKKRLQEAKGAGLIRVAKASGAAPSLATAMVAQTRSRPGDATRSPAPVPTPVDATPPASPAPASPAAMASPSSIRQPREFALPPTPEPRPSASPVARTPQRDVPSNTRVSSTPPVSPEFSPSVFKPSPSSAAKRDARSLESRDSPTETLVAERDADASMDEAAPAEAPPSTETPIVSDNDAARPESRAKSFASSERGLQDDDDDDLDDDWDAATAWFSRRRSDTREEGSRDDAVRGVTWRVPPVPPGGPAAEDALLLEDATSARTLGAVAGKARRMAEATALARRDLAARSRDARGDGVTFAVDGDAPSGSFSSAAAAAAARDRPLGSGVSSRGGGDAATGRRNRVLETARRRREKVLAVENEVLADALDARPARSRIRLAKASAAAADVTLRAALERARLGYAPRLRSAARGASRTYSRGRVFENEGNVFPGARARFGRPPAPPSTLLEAVIRLVGDGGVPGPGGSEPPEVPDRTKRERLPSSGMRTAEPNDAFYRRTKMRAEETRRRGEARALRNARMFGVADEPQTLKPGWDESPGAAARAETTPEGTAARARQRPRTSRTTTTTMRGFLAETKPRAKTSPGTPRGSRAGLSPAAARQRAADARRAAGVHPKIPPAAFLKTRRLDSTRGKKSIRGVVVASRVSPRRSPASSREGKGSEGERFRETAAGARETPEIPGTPGTPGTLRANGFGSERASLLDSGSPDPDLSAVPPPVPPRRVVQDSTGDPRDEIAALRAILDEVVAHLKSTGVFQATASAAESNRSSARNETGESVFSATRTFANPKSGSSSVASGPYALESLDRSNALAMLRAVEARETALRRKWGLRDADGALLSPRRADSSEREAADFAEEEAFSGPHADAARRARASIAEIEADAEHVTARASADARSLRSAGFARADALTDADSVARVWEARSRYVAWRSTVAEPSVVDDGAEDAFDASEVNEEVAERLLDGLLTDIALELSGACDDAAAVVLRQEFTSSAEGDPLEGSSFGIGGYDAGSNLVDDDVVGPAVERGGGMAFGRVSRD